MTKFRFALLLFLLFSASRAGAQALTHVHGHVREAQTGKPLGNVSIFFKNSTIGTTSDKSGYFELTAQNPTDSVSAQIIGYKIITLRVKKNKKQELNFFLQKEEIPLSQVEISATPFPANQIVEKVLDKKAKYNFENHDFYEYSCFVENQVFLTHVPPEILDSENFEPYRHALDSLSRAKKSQNVLPFLKSESISKVFGQKKPRRQKEVIEKSRLSGLFVDKGEVLRQFMGVSFQNQNFYSNMLPLFNRQFVSPLSRSAFAFYRFSLADSVMLDGHFCYEIWFFPKNRQDLAFAGKMWIADTLFALKKIQAQVRPSANLNFLKEYRISQRWEAQKQGVWAPIETKIHFDLHHAGEQRIGFAADLHLASRSFDFGKAKKKAFFSQSLQVLPRAASASPELWEKQRQLFFAQPKTAKNSYQLIDSLRQVREIKRYRKVANLIATGFFDLGRGIQLGHIFYLYGNNPIEGHRFQIGFRTRNKFSKHFIFNTQTGYGTRDKRLKYDLSAEVFLSRKHWAKAGFSFRYDLENVGIDSYYSGNYNSVNLMFAFAHQYGLSQYFQLKQSTRFWIESDWGKTHHQISFSHEKMTPQGDFVLPYFDDEGDLNTHTTLSLLRVNSRFAPNEVYIYDDNTRLPLGEYRSAVFSLSYTAGLNNVLGSGFSFHRLGAGFVKRLKTGVLGTLRIESWAHKIWGTVPLPLLHILQGNDSPFYGIKAFNTLGFTELAADQAIELRLFHSFDGFLLNRVPLLRRLNWRLIANFAAAYGSLRPENQQIYPEISPTGEKVSSFGALQSNQPFVEVGYGLENVLKILRIGVFHRLTYRENTKMPPFTVRAGFCIEF